MPERNVMLLAKPEQVELIMKVMKHDPRYRGGGAGVGFKQAVIPSLDKVTPLAKAMGAVNIIKKTKGGKLVGDNTDGTGYVRSLELLFAEQGRTIKGAKILILGAGGSGRAIAFALAKRGAQLTILNRTVEKATELAKAVNKYAGSNLATGGGRFFIPTILPLQDAVVSVVDDAHSPLDKYSPLGDMEQPVTPSSVKKNLEQTTKLFRKAQPSLIVSDIRIRKNETPMLAEARKHNLRVLDGIPMVVYQGVAALWWLHKKELKEHDVRIADVGEVMWKAAKKR
jgi:shikimate 5-dehydrogenase